MITATQVDYRVCRVCKESKPKDTLHFRQIAKTHRLATACRACELALQQRREQAAALDNAPRREAKPPIPLDMGGSLHRYAVRGGAAKAEKARQQSCNPQGKNQYTTANGMEYQKRSLYLWRCAVEAVIARYGEGTDRYHAECDLLWLAIPRDDDWCSEGRHKAFQNLCEGVIGGIYP